MNTESEKRGTGGKKDSGSQELHHSWGSLKIGIVYSGPSFTSVYLDNCKAILKVLTQQMVYPLKNNPAILS